MENLLSNDLPQAYGLKRKSVYVPMETTEALLFDLDDKSESMIVGYGKGNASFRDDAGTMKRVVGYERYLNGLSGTKFECGRKRCDFILYNQRGNADSFIVLNEQTSALGSVELLTKPIIDRRGNVVYPKGKYEKVEIQLAETLATLLSVRTIHDFVQEFHRKICLMSYKINPRENVKPAQLAFSRYKSIESRETGEEGAILSNKEINNMGFEYRRISHDYVFAL